MEKMTLLLLPQKNKSSLYNTKNKVIKGNYENVEQFLFKYKNV